MREIKFRGMDIKGSWYYGNLAILKKDIDSSRLAGSYISNSVGMPFAYYVRPETVDQFTGLHDKNGKEIYEGDIVRLKNWYPSDMQICFIEGAFCLSDLKTSEYVGDIHYVQHAGVKQAEVIGNIHENK